MYHFIKTTLLTFMCISGILSATNSHANASLNYKPLDKAIAIVEDKLILHSELQQRIALIQSQKPSLKITDGVKQQILDQLILDELQLQIAERVNLQVSDAEVDDAIRNLEHRLQKEASDLATYKAQRKIDDTQLRESIKKEIAIQRVQEGNINRRIAINEREIDDFLASKQGQEWLKTRFRLNHILLPTSNGNEAEVLQLANDIIQQAETQTASFEQLAAQYSKGPNAPKGGDLGWRTKKELPSLFIEQVATLESGEITQPFRSNAGVHILKVNQRRGANPVMVQRYKVRHILIKPTILFTDAEAKAKIDSLYQQLLNGEDFIQLAKQQTEDTSSKFSGGDLGWSTPGTFVPEFEQTMAKTPVGTFSRPFRSQFGWHILRVDDIKVEDMFETVKRNRVAGILRQNRFQDELLLWLQEIRQNAYVEVLR